MKSEIDIEKVWKVEQDILNVFHQFCIDEGITYSLGFGSLLGAIRHNGFIPWDDDIDIIMLRKDYDAFINAWNKKPINGYVLQNEYTKIDDYPNNFCKLRKDHTTFIQSEAEMRTKYHKGIFIDIFPMDRVAPKGIKRKIQMIYFAIYMLYSRGYSDGSSGILGLIQRLLLSFPQKMQMRIKQISFTKMTKWNNKIDYELVIPCTMSFCKKYYPSDLLSNVVFHLFNNKEYCITHHYDGFLSVMYGDYMVLPPENERIWKHSPIIVDYFHNYEEMPENKD